MQCFANRRKSANHPYVHRLKSDDPVDCACMSEVHSLPQRVSRAWLCAMPVRHARVSEQARENISPRKIDVTSKPPVGGISVVTLIRTDTTLDHSQKAEKVCRQDARRSAPRTRKVAHDVSYIASFSRAALDLGVHARGLAKSSVSAMHFYVHDKPKCWAEAPVKIARMTLTIKLDGNWSSFQLANNTPPLSVTGSVIAPSARMLFNSAFSCG